jgi:hypothetical protein
MASTWSKADDQKLFALFRKPPSKGGLNPTHTKPADIRKVIEKHWPGKKYESFAPLYRRKCAAFLTEQEVAGARAAKGKSRLFVFS